MALDNLFTALRKYRSSVGRDPLEDYLTEAFAWLLRRHDGLAQAWLNSLSERLTGASWKGRSSATWKTQVSFDGGRLDMIAELGDVAIVFEHKVWSPLGENQLGRYKAAGQARWPGGCTLILITATTTQHEPGADVSLLWADVYRVVRCWLDGEGKGAELVAEFLGLLAEEGLAPSELVSRDAIVSYLPSKAFEVGMLAVVREVMKKADWSFVYDKLAWPEDERTPYLRGSRPPGIEDGRLGLDLLGGWRPGIFLGIMLDGEDHQVKPSAPNKGPDFCVVLSFDPKKGTPSREAYLASPEMKRLQERLGREREEVIRRPGSFPAIGEPPEPGKMSSW